MNISTCKQRHWGNIRQQTGELWLLADSHPVTVSLKMQKYWKQTRKHIFLCHVRQVDYRVTCLSSLPSSPQASPIPCWSGAPVQQPNSGAAATTARLRARAQLHQHTWGTAGPAKEGRSSKAQRGWCYLHSQLCLCSQKYLTFQLYLMREKPWGVRLPNLHVVIMKWLDLES